jgi:hypothetical protein
MARYGVEQLASQAGVELLDGEGVVEFVVVHTGEGRLDLSLSTAGIHIVHRVIAGVGGWVAIQNRVRAQEATARRIVVAGVVIVQPSGGIELRARVADRVGDAAGAALVAEGVVAVRVAKG